MRPGLFVIDKLDEMDVRMPKPTCWGYAMDSFTPDLQQLLKFFGFCRDKIGVRSRHVQAGSVEMLARRSTAYPAERD